MFGAFIYTDEQIKKSTYAGFYTKIENFKFICTGWGCTLFFPWESAYIERFRCQKWSYL